MSKVSLCVGVLLAFHAISVSSQSFTFVPDDTALSAPLGSEIVFNVTMTNTSASALTLAIVRRVNDLPSGWESSMCLAVCFPPITDSILTTPEFGSSPLNPGESRPFSMHVFTAANPGTGIVRVAAWDTRNPSDYRLLTFTASATPNSAPGVMDLPKSFTLSTNFPNPFNPETSIRYGIPQQSRVILNIYDVAGREITTLVNENQEPGNLDVRWNGTDSKGSQVSSGTYFCRMVARRLDSRDQFVAVRKLLLLR